jgi:hypothetical protein
MYLELFIMQAVAQVQRVEIMLFMLAQVDLAVAEHLAQQMADLQLREQSTRAVAVELNPTTAQ